MDIGYILIGIAIMAIMTYLIRVAPMVIFRKKIENVRIKSFLHYIPYTVLSAMTFPAIFSSTQSELGAIAGCVVAVLLAYLKKGLLVVALGAAVTVYIVSLLPF
ncbi:MAG: AzlD domain-containing protein [Lachnospiraceae bacterium]|nr:AzlD domain-containing protein [Lachnospiraceae bacterium]